MKMTFGIKAKAIFVFTFIFSSFLGFALYIGSSSIKDVKLSSYKVGEALLLQQSKEYYKEYTSAEKKSLETFLKNIEENVESIQYQTIKIFQNSPFIDEHLYWNHKKYLTHLPNNQLINKKNDLTSIWSPTWMKVDNNVLKKIELTAMLNEVFEALQKRTTSIVASYFLASEGFIRYYPSFDILKAMPTDFVPLDGRSSKPATPKLNPKRELIWSELYSDSLGKGLMISAVTPVYNKDIFLGVVGVDITLDKLVKNHINQKQDKSGYSILLDKEFKPIALPSSAMQDIYKQKLKDGDKLNSKSLLTFDSPFKKIFNKIKSEKNGFVKVVLEDKTIYMSFARLDKFDWFYANILEEKALMNATNILIKNLDSTLNKSIKNISISLVVLFLILLISIFIFINTLLKPIIELSKVTKAIATGDLTKSINLKAKDEIGVLIKNFENMKDSILLHEKKQKEQIEFQNIIMETVNAPIYIKDDLGKL